MGTDIHCFVEKYNKETGKWENLSIYKKNDDGTFKPVDIYDGRNLELFSLIAGVGSFYVNTWNIGCLVSPRGVPDDLSPEVEEEYDGGECFFNETWYDLCELEAYEYMMKDSASYIKKLKQEIKLLKNEPVDEYDDNDAFGGLALSLGSFMDSIRTVLSAYNLWCHKPNEVRVIMWFDS